MNYGTKRVQKYPVISRSYKNGTEENIGLIRGLLGKLTVSSQKSGMIKNQRLKNYTNNKKRKSSLNKTRGEDKIQHDFEKLRGTFHFDRNINRRYIRNVIHIIIIDIYKKRKKRIQCIG